jgi:cytochrome c
MAPARPGGFGLGRTALPEEIAAWDIDVRPDGLGLPAGSGDVWTGEEVFVESCAVCHGDFGEAVGRWPVLAGGRDTLTREDPVKTIGSYWPYLSTVYDYINRAMPFGYAQSLEPDDIYAITAYLLYVNDIVGDDFELSNENFLDVAMPNADNFFMDDRAEAELPLFSVEPCMESCKASVEITMHASVLDVTPETEEDTASATPVVAEAVTAEVATAEVVEEVATEAPAAEAPAAEVVQVAAAPDPALVAAGEGVFRACRACHQVGEGATNRSGPHLNGVVGRVIGSVDGFRYSNGFAEAASAGTVWTQESLAAFLADPRGAMPGTKMSFRGISNEADIAAMIAYLESFGG